MLYDNCIYVYVCKNQIIHVHVPLLKQGNRPFPAVSSGSIMLVDKARICSIAQIVYQPYKKLNI